MAARGLFNGDSINGVGLDGLSAFLLNNGLLKIDYFLEVQLNNNARVVSLPEQPQNVDFAFTYAEDIVYTFSDKVHFRQIALPRTGDIILSGEISNKPRLATKYDRASSQIKLVNVTGEDLLINFKEFIDNYFRNSSSTSSPTNFSLTALGQEVNPKESITLVIRALKENIHYKCTVTSFTFAKSISKKRVSGYTWQLSLRLYEPIEPTEPGVFEQVFGAVTDAINFVSTYPQFVAQGLDTISAQVDVGLSNVKNAATNLGKSIGAIGNAANNLTATVINIPADVLDTVSNALDGVYELLDQKGKIEDTARAAASRVDKSWDRFKSRTLLTKVIDEDPPKIPETGPMLTREPQTEESQAALQLTAYQLMEYTYALENILAFSGAFDTTASAQQLSRVGFLGSDGGFGQLANFYTDTTGRDVDTRYSGPTVSYTIRAGESLLTIANRLIGDPAEWVTLAQINDCPDAYTLGDGTPLVGGAVIRVPVTGRNFLHDLGQNPSNLLEGLGDNRFGIDFEIGADGDLVFDPQSASTMLLRGEDNLRQGILNTLRTVNSEITLNPELGTPIGLLVGAKFTQSSATYIAVKIREALLLDDRIADVQDITIETQGGDALLITLRIITALGDNFRVATAV